MATTIEATQTIVAVTCGQCGVLFGMSETFYNKRREDHKTWYCPNGHPRAYNGPSEEEKEIERLKSNLKWEQDYATRTREDLDRTEKSLRATKGVVTKLKKRAAHGVCPCCTRTFQDLARHMASKHPGFAHEDESA